MQCRGKAKADENKSRETLLEGLTAQGLTAVAAHSHSMVAAGLLVTSSTTRLVDAAALVRDARGDARQHIVGHAAPIGGHGIFGADRTQHNRVAVGARSALHGEVTGTGVSVFGNVVGRRLFLF